MAGQLTIDTLKASSGVLATQNGMTGVCKAWVWFTHPSTINASFNCSSITFTGTGSYIMNFTTAMGSANYCPVIGSNNSTTNANTATDIFQGGTSTSSAFYFQHYENNTLTNFANAAVAIFAS